MPIGPAVVSAAASVADVISNFFGGQSEAKRQKKFAQNQIQWRVADAEKAGIHPLYAMGITPTSYAPQQVGLGLGEMGQNISRAMTATQTRKERMMTSMLAMEERKRGDMLFRQQVERNSLENDYLRSQIARLNGAQMSPEMPSLGGNNDPTARFLPQPAMPVVSSEDDIAREAGYITDYGYSRTADGLAVVPSRDMYERIEDNPGQQLGWWLRNNLLPMINARGLRPPDTREFPNRPGYEWFFHHDSGSWRERRAQRRGGGGW